MRLRNRFLAFIVLITLAISGAIFYYNRPSVQAKIRETAISALREALGAEVSVDSISIGLLSATAKNLKLSMNSQFIQIEIEKVQVGVGIIRIPKKGEINVRDFVDKIILTNPKIRIVVYADSERKESESPKILSSELSEMIIKNFPFRTAKIRNCSIEILTKNGRRLADFNGLNGNLLHQNDELNFELSGKSGSSLTNNIEIVSKITPDIKRQFLSVKLDDVSIRSPLMELEGYLSFVLDSDMKFFFKDDYFPEAVIPDGTLSVNEFKVRQRERGVTFAGSMNVAAKGGILSVQNISTTFGQGEMNGFAEMDLNLGGKTVGELDLSVSADENTFIKTKLELLLTEILNPKLYVKSNGEIIRQKKNLIGFNADGDISEGKIFLRNLEVKSAEFGKGKFVGTVVPGLNYSLDGNIHLDTKIDENIKALGDARISVRGEDFLRFPHILGFFNLKIKKENEYLNLPLINAETYGDSLKLTANSGGVQLLGNVELKDDFAYNADLEISDGKIKEIFAFFGQNTDELERINVSAKINGDTNTLNFSSTPLVFTKNFGNFIADLSGQISQKQKNITINSLKWTKDEKSELLFKGNVKSAENSWDATLFSQNIQANMVFDENFTKIDTGEIKIEKMPLSFLDAFYKSQNKADSLLKSGELYGDVKLSGKLDDIAAQGEISVKNAYVENIKNISADMNFSVSDSTINVSSFMIKRDDEFIVRSQKIEKIGDKIFGKIDVENLMLEEYLVLAGINNIKGNVSATINADGDKISAKIVSDSIFYEKLKAQNLNAQLSATKDSISIDKLNAEFLGIKASASAKAVHNKFVIENPQFQIKLNGDFLAAAGSFVESPVGGKGKGELEISGNIRGGELRIRQGHILIPEGELSVYPFTSENIKNVYANVKTTERNRVSIDVRGVLDRKKLTIINDYEVGELTPFTLANLNFGVLRVWTDKGGIPVFLPGFMENRRGNVGYVETAAKGNIPTFTVASHPDNLVTLAGTLLLRKTDLTFPLLDDVEYPHEFDAFPFLFFDLDIRPADRTVNYYYQIGNEKRRRGFRVIEFAIDPSGTVGVRGNDADGTFRVVGRLRSYSGYMFYGKMFDRNFEIGLDFQPELLPNGFGYDNLPIIWGKAETYSDTSRFERIIVKLKTRDPQTGELRDRGRFTELVIVPQNDNFYASQEEAAAEYYKEFSSELLKIEQIGELASGIGDSYISSYFLSYWGRQIARKIGLDSFRFETAIMGNTVELLAARQINENTTRNWNYLAFANSGFAIGKYVGNGNLFLKYETEFVDRELEITPEYKIGIEYQPLPYLWMDFNYGIFREKETENVVMNPQFGVQFRMPFSTLRKKTKSD